MKKLIWLASLTLLACSGEAKSPVQTTTDVAVEVDGDMGSVSDTAGARDAAPAAPDTRTEFRDSPADLTDPPDLAVVVPDVGRDVGTLSIAERCFADREIIGAQFDGPDYDQFNPNVGSHCLGTNHQHIFGIEQVVFLGDSVTVGTPPTLSANFYRSKLADDLANKFNLLKPGFLWQVYDPIGGTSGQQESGSFQSCAKWGGRTDDLLKGGDQIGKCFPDGGSDKRTLVILTMGGNDISAITKAGGTEGRPLAEVQQMTEQAVADLEEALNWLKDPVRFPNGSFVIFGTPFEFTDGTGQTSSCPAAELGDLEAWDNPADLADLVVWLDEQYMRVAVDTGTDMIFMLEHFCGHGFVATGPQADGSAGCYLGPNTARWFDDTCIHPNPTGHGVISGMFMEVVNEVGATP